MTNFTLNVLRLGALQRRPLTALQQQGAQALVAQFSLLGDGSTAHLAYVLATAWHETATRMQPIREFGLGRGHSYGRPDHTGQVPYGRGFVQLTWDHNYAKADQRLGLGGALVRNYDLALQLDIASKIIVRGMIEGWFTGRKLSSYTDFVDMRRIINGTDRAALVASYARVFLPALQA
jgi:hypothetical protein